jgi:hypothetical protein
MAERHFEVFFRFRDEVDARAFMDRAAADDAVREHGIRPVEPRESLLDEILKRRKPDEPAD